MPAQASGMPAQASGMPAQASGMTAQASRMPVKASRMSIQASWVKTITPPWAKSYFLVGIYAPERWPGIPEV